MSAWSFITAAAVRTSAAAASVNGTMKPNTGDLCVATLYTVGTGAPNTPTISDTGSGGWTALNSLITLASGDFANGTGMASWWKVATAADNNGGSGVPVTVGASGTIATTFIEVDVFRLSSGTVTGPDLTASIALVATGLTNTLHPAAGSTHSTNTDELAWTAVGGQGNMAPTGTNTFTGTSTAANLTNSIVGSSDLQSQYAVGVQASATAGSNTWLNNWTTNRIGSVLAATFYATGSGGSTGLHSGGLGSSGLGTGGLH